MNRQLEPNRAVSTIHSDTFGGLTLKQWGTLASVAVIALTTAVPLALGHRRFDSSVAASTVAALASLWAAVFTLESLRDLVRTRQAELQAHLLPSLQFSRGQAELLLSNLGKSAAFDVVARYAIIDADGDFLETEVASAPSVVLAETIEVGHLDSLDFWIVDKGLRLGGVAIELHYKCPAWPNGVTDRIRFTPSFDINGYVRSVCEVWPSEGNRSAKLKSLIGEIMVTLQDGGVTDISVREGRNSLSFVHTNGTEVGTVSTSPTFTLDEIRSGFTAALPSILIGRERVLSERAFRQELIRSLKEDTDELDKLMQSDTSS